MSVGTKIHVLGLPIHTEKTRYVGACVLFGHAWMHARQRFRCHACLRLYLITHSALLHRAACVPWPICSSHTSLHPSPADL